jgi:hypothetical protein
MDSKKPKSKKDGVLVAASSVLQTLLANSKSPLSDQFVRWKLWRYWDEIVGVNIARVSVPVEVSGGKLLIWVKSSGQMQDMYYVSDAIMEKVNKFLGKKQITSVRYTLEESKVPSREDVRDLE